MSAAHDDHDHGAAGHHAPERPETTHPVLWTVGLLVACGLLIWVFFGMFGVGKVTAREHGPIERKAPAAKPVDHAALIAARDQSVLDRGESVYGKNCQSCHGAKGDTPTAGARNFRTDPFKAAWGGGPHGFYLTLTKGYAAMPPFANLTHEDRYAVAHYVREVLQKGAAVHVADDSDAVKKQIPAPGSAGGEETKVDPASVPEPALTHRLMAATAADSAQRVAAARSWLSGLSGNSDLALVAAAARTRPQWLVDLHQAATANLGSAAIADLLINAQGSGEADPALALLPKERLAALAARLAGASL